jgi:predicted peptidase
MGKAIELSDRDNIPIFVLGRSLGGFSAISTLSQKPFFNAARGLIL